MRTNITQLDPVAREIPLVATVGSAWDMVKKEHVIEALKADAEYLKANIPESTGYISVEKGTRSEDPALRLLHVKEFPLI